ncbi:TMAO reductase sytem sensor TorS [Vibrio cholerae]|nr:TMAO reductase sytem sensor TorS [Vibrio cholerae]
MDASNQVTTAAVSKLSNTLYDAQLILTVLGLLGLVIVVWIVDRVEGRLSLGHPASRSTHRRAALGGKRAARRRRFNSRK